MISLQNITLQHVTLPSVKRLGISLHMLRLDLIHPEISGNKWFKLKYNIEYAKEKGYKKILTFGGAYSNHIVATAAACKYLGLDSIGIIRGEKHVPLNHSLAFAQNCGMKLEFVSRELYRNKTDENFLKDLQVKYLDAYIIPEGGANNLAIKGCAEINQLIPGDTDLICLACGTGSTMAGIVSAANSNQEIIGFSALKGGDFLLDEVENFLKEETTSEVKFAINSSYHFGGYAKYNQQLIDFMNDFYSLTNIPLDFIYTAKMVYGLMDMIKSGEISSKRIVAIHTGGLQGNYTIKEKLIY